MAKNKKVETVFIKNKVGRIVEVPKIIEFKETVLTNNGTKEVIKTRNFAQELVIKEQAEILDEAEAKKILEKQHKEKNEKNGHVFDKTK